MIKYINDNSTHYFYQEGDTVRQLSTDKVFEVKEIDRIKKTVITTTGIVLALSPDIKPTESTLKNCQVQDNRKKEFELKVKYFDSKMPKLEKIEKGDWIDVRVVSVLINGNPVEWTNNEIEYKKGDYIQAYLGIALELPVGHEAHVAPRGSTFKNYGTIQTNSVGVVDESYNGNNDQWFVPLYATRDAKFIKFDRIAQFRIMRKMPNLKFLPVEMLNKTNRGGHGSTGTK